MSEWRITPRVPGWLEDELRRIFAATGEDRAAGVARIVEEWWAREHFPEIEYRDGPAGRRASLRGGPDVWEIVMVAREYGADRAGLNAHFGWLAPEKIDQALAFAERFPAPVAAIIEENEIGLSASPA